MLDLILVLLATFWAWATLRYILESYASRFFVLTRSFHPLLVASMPMYVLWPDQIAALAVAGAVGLLTAAVDRIFGPTETTPIPMPRRRTGGLPPLP